MTFTLRRPDRFEALVGAAILAVAIAANTVAAPADPTSAARQAFDARLAAYVALHRAGANETGGREDASTPHQITARELALASRIRAARRDARRGDVLGEPVRTMLTRLIRDTYARRPAPMRAHRRDDPDELARFNPVVNMPYPAAHPLVTFPADLLAVLPRLPQVLEYRLVQRHLILRDVEANLIVDVLTHAVP